VREFLAIKQITVLEHPVYSPNLVPNDFLSVPEDKGNIERRYFDAIDDFRSNTTAARKAIPQNQLQNVLKGGIVAGIGA